MRSTKTIGLLFQEIENPFFSKIIKEVEDVAQRSGYTVIISNSENNPEKERIYIEALSGLFSEFRACKNWCY